MNSKKEFMKSKREMHREREGQKEIVHKEKEREMVGERVRNIRRIDCGSEITVKERKEGRER